MWSWLFGKRATGRTALGSHPQIAGWQSRLLTAINVYRERYGSPRPLRPSAAANRFVVNALNQRIALGVHTPPPVDAAGIPDHALDFAYMWGPLTPESFVNFLTLPGPARDLLLAVDVTELGMSLVRDENGRLHWLVLFIAKPAPLPRTSPHEQLVSP